MFPCVNYSLLKYFSKEEPLSSKRSRKDDGYSTSESDSDSESESVMPVATGSGPNTTESERSSCDSHRRSGYKWLKQASEVKREWTKGRENWLKYTNGKGMFCILCSKYDKRPYNRTTWNEVPFTRNSA